MLDRKNIFGRVLVRFLVVLVVGKVQRRPCLSRTVRSTMTARRLLFFLREVVCGVRFSRRVFLVVAASFGGLGLI